MTPVVEPQSGSDAAEEVQYLTQVVKTMRGREARTRSKMENQGWELVSQNQGTLLTGMIFRRPKPKNPLLQIFRALSSAWASFRRLAPKSQLIASGVVAAVLLAGIVGVSVAASGGGAAPEAAPAAPTPTPEATPTPSQMPTPSETPSEPTITDITVDKLLDKLNSPGMGGIQLGDQFRVTAELFESDAWGKGASGDYSVMLKAKDGADDLLVFVEESDADEWTDGTKVEMVLETVEVTISGETTDGWLKARSVKTFSE